MFVIKDFQVGNRDVNVIEIKTPRKLSSFFSFYIRNDQLIINFYRGNGWKQNKKSFKRSFKFSYYFDYEYITAL
jgi:hypothetical protein